ncbi:hypothetical protein K2173_019913 [Erythroxylum novogranatense]|uniref:Transferase n=1 Tax=Erythroxylum novogranatense TaxID=1862640 RepID=A0AAV8U9S1_9ROSI|nr:hypothetical protein K2173_019913 [Erythroxylum novogranatense]
MEVQIISKEIVKPSFPTPDCLRIHKLSILDQMVLGSSFPIILFYSTTSSYRYEISNHLKRSLSKALTLFYPFAGRLSSCLQVDCNDDGVSYVEANVGCDISMIVEHPDTEQLKGLLPSEPDHQEGLLSVQVNYFMCDGIAISVLVKHLLGDASSLATFVKSWADVARWGHCVEGMIFDCTSLFPPMKCLDFSSVFQGNSSLFQKTVNKRFLFEGSKIADLRKKFGNGNLTRYEAVSALIWRAFMIASKQMGEKSMKNHMMVSLVDLRRRMKQGSEGDFIGNLCRSTIAHCSSHEITDYNQLAGKIHDSIQKMNDEWDDIDKMMNTTAAVVKELADEEASSTRVFAISSWCRIPFYETNFGWGKPLWVGTASTIGRQMGGIFMDTCDGQGIEAWIGLPVDYMTHLEQDSDIRQFASFTAST